MRKCEECDKEVQWTYLRREWIESDVERNGIKPNTRFLKTTELCGECYFPRDDDLPQCTQCKKRPAVPGYDECEICGAPGLKVETSFEKLVQDFERSKRRRR